MNKICYSLSRFLFTSGRFLVRSIIIFWLHPSNLFPVIMCPLLCRMIDLKKQIHVKSIWGQVVFCVNDVGVESGPVSLNPSIGRWCRVARGADSNRLLAIGGNKFQNRMRDRVSKAHKVFFLSLFSICVVLFSHPERSYTEVGRKNDNDHREIPRCDHQWRAICFIYPPFFLPVSHTRFFLPLPIAI